MGRKRIYQDDAERKKAYRKRLSSCQKQIVHSQGVPAKRRPLSRPKRLATVLSEAQALLQEYEEWLSAIPESLQGSGVADRLRETVEHLTQVVDLLAEIDLPKGFGRD